MLLLISSAQGKRAGREGERERDRDRDRDRDRQTDRQRRRRRRRRERERERETPSKKTHPITQKCYPQFAQSIPFKTGLMK